MSFLKSKKYFQQAQKVLIGGTSCPARSFKSAGGDPVIVKSAKGSKLYDVDGREYTDYCLSCGANILGHANRNVVLSAKKHAERGLSFGTITKAEIDLSQHIIEKVPSIERIRFVNSGTEATLCAIRLARGVTGRKRIVCFEGMYHGFHGLVPVVHHQGQSCDCSEGEIILPFNDEGALEENIKKYHKDIAAVILEPVAAHMGIVSARTDFLKVLRNITEKYGILLIFDEVMTGFRGFPGCVQSKSGIIPDLTCLGTVIGGGFPIGVYGGRADVMRRLAPEGKVCQAGAFAANPVILRAGMMALRLMNDSFFTALNQKADRFAQRMNKFFDECNIDAKAVQFYSMLNLQFSRKEARNYTESQAARNPALYEKIFQHLFSRGIHFPSAEMEPFFISGKHSKRDLRDLEESLKIFFQGEKQEYSTIIR